MDLKTNFDSPILGMLRHVGVRKNQWMIEDAPDSTIIHAELCPRDRVWLEATTKQGVVGFRYSSAEWLQQIGKRLERGDRLQEFRAITSIHDEDGKVKVESPTGVLVLACHNGMGGVSAVRISIEASGSSGKFRTAIREATESSLGPAIWQQVVSALDLVEIGKSKDSQRVLQEPIPMAVQEENPDLSEGPSILQVVSQPPKEPVREPAEAAADGFKILTAQSHGPKKVAIPDSDFWQEPA